ncbi:MAG: YggT family protein [Syntrophobacteria bacterium]
MFILGNLVSALANVIGLVLNLYLWIIIIRAVISWVSPDPYNPIVRFLYNITDPVLLAIRRRLPLYFGGIDFSPIIVILAIIFLQRFLVASLHDLARSLVH